MQCFYKKKVMYPFPFMIEMLEVTFRDLSYTYTKRHFISDRNAVGYFQRTSFHRCQGRCHILIQNVISFLTGTLQFTFKERHSIVVRDLSYTYTKRHFISDRNVVGYFQRTSFHCCQGRCHILIQNSISFLTGTQQVTFK